MHVSTIIDHVRLYVRVDASYYTFNKCTTLDTFLNPRNEGMLGDDDTIFQNHNASRKERLPSSKGLACKVSGL